MGYRGSWARNLLFDFWEFVILLRPSHFAVFEEIFFSVHGQNLHGNVWFIVNESSQRFVWLSWLLSVMRYATCVKCACQKYHKSYLPWSEKGWFFLGLWNDVITTPNWVNTAAFINHDEHCLLVDFRQVKYRFFHFFLSFLVARSLRKTTDRIQSKWCGLSRTEYFMHLFMQHFM